MNTLILYMTLKCFARENGEQKIPRKATASVNMYRLHLVYQ